MTTDTAPPAIGDNQPPPEAAITTRVDALIVATDTWTKESPVIQGEEAANKARDFFEQLNLAAKDAERERERQLRPHLDGAAKVRGVFDPMLRRLDVAKQRMKGLLQTWLEAERRRIAADKAKAEEEARKATQAAAVAAFQATAPDAGVDAVVKADELGKHAAAAALAVDRANSAKPALRGDLAPRAMAERTYWSAEITDYAAALAHYAQAPTIKAEVQRLADADARTHHEALAVPGLKAKSEKRL